MTGVEVGVWGGGVSTQLPTEKGRMHRGIKAALMGLLTVTVLGFGVAELQAQDVTGRFQVLVYNLEPMQDADDDFGKDVAKELRDLIDNLATHTPVEEKELKDQLKRFDVDEDDLNCNLARQLAGQMSAAVVVCGDYAGPEEGYTLNTRFVTVETGEEFAVDVSTFGKRQDEEAAQYVFSAFEQLVQQQRHAHFCAEYAASQQWDNALENCNRAIELNPTGIPSIYTRGMVRMNQEDFQAAMEDFDKVLEMNPIHENGLKAAGYTATKLGDRPQALHYYTQLLDLNPSDAQVRMNIAYDAAQAGDPYGAKVLIDAGIEIDPENVDLHTQRAGYAMSAAERLFAEANNQVTAEAAELYREAIESYNVAFAANGAESPVAQRRNVVSALMRLDQLEEAQATLEEALQAYPDEAQLWSVNADVLKRMDRLDEAVAALTRVSELDPEYPNVLARKGMWQLEAGQSEEAVATLRQAVESGEQDGNRIANLLFGSGHTEGVQPQNWSRAVSLFASAAEFAEDEDTGIKVRFWHGYALLKQGQAIAGDQQTLDIAQRTRGLFSQAQSLLQSSASYASQDGSPVNAAQVQNLIDASSQYLDMMNAIIERGR